MIGKFLSLPYKIDCIMDKIEENQYIVPDKNREDFEDAWYDWFESGKTPTEDDFDESFNL